MIQNYSAYHMKVISAIPLQLPSYTGSQVLQEVLVEEGMVASVEGPYGDSTFQFGFDAQGFVVITVPGYARMRIENNRRIVVDSRRGVSPVLVSVCITGIALVFVLKSRNVVTFHGSAVAYDKKAYMIVGDQGSGKSTTAAVLASRGCRMLCDDIIPFLPPMVLPGIPRAKLLDDAFIRMGGKIEQSAHLFDGIDKYQMKIHESHESVNLAGIFILETGDADTVQCIPLKGSGKISRVLSHMSVVKGFEDAQALFRCASEGLAAVPVTKVTRPKDLFTLDQVSLSILSLIFQDDNQLLSDQIIDQHFHI